MVLAALEATLEIYRSPEKLKHQIPVLQLLATPLENLQQRCERIAPLLAECEQVASAKVVAQDSIWLDTGSSQLSSASWSIALRPAQGTPERLSHLFSQADPQVVGRVEEDILRLDFRAIFPPLGSTPCRSVKLLRSRVLLRGALFFDGNFRTRLT